MTGYSTKNWIIGILVAGWVASFVVGSLHGMEVLGEPANPLWHTTRDWVIVMVVLLPLTYVLARFLPSGGSQPSQNSTQFEE